MAESRVLVVDDDDAIRTLVTRVLRREHFAVEQASNGEEALATLRTHRYGAVVLDLMMPVVSGFEVVSYLNTHDDAGKPSVVIISAASERDMKKVESPCIHAVLRKPFELPELVAAVRACSEHTTSESPTEARSHDGPSPAVECRTMFGQSAAFPSSTAAGQIQRCMRSV